MMMMTTMVMVNDGDRFLMMMKLIIDITDRCTMTGERCCCFSNQRSLAHTHLVRSFANVCFIVVLGSAHMQHWAILRPDINCESTMSMSDQV